MVKPRLTSAVTVPCNPRRLMAAAPAPKASPSFRPHALKDRMLSFFRRIINSKAGVVVTLLFLVIIALAFAAGDISGLRNGIRGQLSGDAVATVAGRPIAAPDLNQRVRRDFDSFRQQQPTLDLATFVTAGGFEGVLQRMIYGIALQVFADRAGLIVGKRLIDGQIAGISAFQDLNGKFSPDKFHQFLDARRVTEPALRDDIRNDLLVTLLTTPANNAVVVPDQLVQPYVALFLERRVGLLGAIPAQALPPGPAPSDADVQAFYQHNLARYTVPERRIVRYALVTPEQVAAAARPSDAEVAQAYEQQRARFQPTEKRSIAQVTLLDQAAATQFAAKVKGGTPIDAAARAAGLEPAKLANLDKNALTAQASPAVANAAFAAAKGAIIGPIKTPLGYAVARVDAIEQVPGKSLDQARPELVASLVQTKTAQQLGRVHDGLEDAITNHHGFDDLMRDQKLSPVTTPPLLANGTNPDQPGAAPDAQLQTIIAPAFQAEEGDDAALVPVGKDSFAVVKLDKIVHAAPRPLAEIKDRVAADARTERASVEARKLADAVVAKVAHGMPLAQALAETKLHLPAPRPLDVPRAALSRENAPAPLVTFFKMAPRTAKLLPLPQGGWGILYLDHLQPGDPKAAPQVAQGLRTELTRALGDEYRQQLVGAIRDQVGVTRDPSAILKVRNDLLGGGAGPAQP